MRYLYLPTSAVSQASSLPGGFQTLIDFPLLEESWIEKKRDSPGNLRKEIKRKWQAVLP
jgi:hypothetical protein